MLGSNTRRTNYRTGRHNGNTVTGRRSFFGRRRGPVVETTTGTHHNRGGLFHNNHAATGGFHTGTHGGTTAPIHHHKRHVTLGDKISGAMMRLRGTLTNRPGVKAAGTRRMHGTDGRGSRRHEVL